MTRILVNAHAVEVPGPMTTIRELHARAADMHMAPDDPPEECIVTIGYVDPDEPIPVQEGAHYSVQGMHGGGCDCPKCRR